MKESEKIVFNLMNEWYAKSKLSTWHKIESRNKCRRVAV